MRRLVRILLVVALGGCAARPDRSLVWEGLGRPRVEATSRAVARLGAVSPGLRRGPWGDAEDATLQLLETERPEEPHIHARHDLTVVLLRGHGAVVVEGRRHLLQPGDVLQVARGRVHALEPDGPVVGLAIFTPRLTEPDNVPVSALRDSAPLTQ